jgi:hypothetical protein
MTYASQSRSFPLSPSYSISFPPLASCSRTNTWTPRHYHAAAVRSQTFTSFYLSPYALTSIPFIPHHRHPRGRRYDTKLRHSRQATRMYIGLPSYPSRRASESLIIFNQGALSPFLPTCVLVRLGRSFSRPASLSRPFHFSPSLLFLDDTSTLAAPILDTPALRMHGVRRLVYWMDQRGVSIGGSGGDGSEGWEGTIEDGRASILLFHLSLLIPDPLSSYSIECVPSPSISYSNSRGA